MKYLATLYSTVGSIKNLARTSLASKIPGLRGRAPQRLKGFLRLTEQVKELEETVDRLENQLKLRDRLLSIISHDTRGPLISLKSSLQLLSNKHINIDELREITVSLRLQVEQLNGFLENLLHWTRNHQDQIKPIKKNLLLCPLVMETIALLSPLANKKKVRIHCFVDEKERVYADAEMIKTILRNLVSNAIKFCVANDSVFIQASQTLNGVNISVTDTGKGIRQENLETIFHFSNLGTRGTKDEVGTGLGLALSREFAEKLGGVIKASSEEGKGSCFEFTVPQMKNGQEYADVS